MGGIVSIDGRGGAIHEQLPTQKVCFKIFWTVLMKISICPDFLLIYTE